MIRRHTALALMIVLLVGPHAVDRAAADGTVLGRSAPFTLERLPMGRLKHGITRLPPRARARAMAWLHRFDFPAADAVTSLRVDAQGSVLYVDTAPAQAPQAAPARSGSATPAPITTADAFRLHSRPGARNVLHLDFDGHRMSGTAWNANFSGNADLEALPYDTDGNPAVFSSAELTAILQIWQRVAEDYAPFDVDITTEQPAVSGPTVGRVVITRDSDRTGRAMPAQGAGGVAYVGVFGSVHYGYYSPALVYANRLGNGREDYVSEAASHEAGHNLGLSHDGTAGATYYAGHGTGATSWAPIMGVGYGRAVTTWSANEYPGASNPEDDVALLRARLGAPADDHADHQAGASALNATADGTVSATTLAQDAGNLRPENKGVIGSRIDVDIFSFVAASGPLNLTATPHRMPTNAPGGNLDLRLDLYSAGGALVASAAPNGDPGASLATSLAAGRYFLHVSGIGDPLAPYSDYGSLGRYTLGGRIPVAGGNTVPPAPNPMYFELAPHSPAAGRVAMRAALATDDAGAPVQYRFECVAGGAGCGASAWQGGRDLALTGLAPGVTYRFQVRARDAFGNETSPSVAASVVVRGNTAPVATTDRATVRRFGAVILAVLANDRDVDGDALRLGDAGPARRGNLLLLGGQLLYQSTGATGVDQFSYTVSDGRGGSARGTVVVTVVP